jgi:hypothetical protein
MAHQLINILGKTMYESYIAIFFENVTGENISEGLMVNAPHPCLLTNLFPETILCKSTQRWSLQSRKFKSGRFFYNKPYLYSIRMVEEVPGHEHGDY